ncbi:MAG: hypothetical protein O7C59_03855, partial [Rickettsia endosymbiont of Ixodes persulcatus]|nr:hypothetical protein [Rickettsia endosymbiont of Ixodes persulcatus]
MLLETSYGQEPGGCPLLKVPLSMGGETILKWLVMLSISKREFLVCLRPNKRAESREQRLRKLRVENFVL